VDTYRVLCGRSDEVGTPLGQVSGVARWKLSHRAVAFTDEYGWSSCHAQTLEQGAIARQAYLLRA
jgi:hypothetical protein